MEAPIARKVAELFARQDGVASVEQLSAVGVTRGVARGKLRSGEWTRLSERVVRTTSAPPSWRQQVRAAWLDAGRVDTAVSHASAARLHGFDGFDRNPELHVTVCGGTHRSSLPGVAVHRSTVLRTCDCAVVSGIRVVSKPIALCQIATGSVDAAAQAIDGMLRGGDSPLWIRTVAEQWRRPGLKGAEDVLRLLHDRVGRRLPRSWFQRIASRILQSRGVTLVDEHPVRDPTSNVVLAELDLAHPALKIGLECQSWEWHGSPSAQAADARRRRRLRLLGWDIVDVWWTDLDRIDEVIAELQFLIDRRVPALLP